MFTGLVEARVAVRSFEARAGGARLVLPAPETGADQGLVWEPRIGESIAVSGCCLTVAELLDPRTGEPWHHPRADLVFDLSRETLERTWFGGLAAGRWVNLERALRVGDRLGGHLVQGHVDAVGRVMGREAEGGGNWRFRFEVAAGFERYLVDKGSVTLDGISLTVVAPRGREFEVAVIPLTFEHTSLEHAAVGQAINVEVDALAKWIEKLLPAYAAGRAGGSAAPG
jgi:riboflavin synthase